MERADILHWQATQNLYPRPGKYLEGRLATLGFAAGLGFTAGWLAKVSNWHFGQVRCLAPMVLLQAGQYLCPLPAPLPRLRNLGDGCGAALGAAEAGAVEASVPAGAGFGAAFGTAAAVAGAAVTGSVPCVAAVSCKARAEKRLAVLAVVAGVVCGGDTGTKEPRLEASEAGRHGSSWNRIFCVSSLPSQLSFR